ncbi:hypothetical protein [Sphingobium sp.]|uniref:hypothetical protein n=2 Tax=Sphingobium sp. TaxID=1912891 RepID=UPI00257BB76E|nr:hypothetical protein [Sphingobium sp.]
MQHWILSGMTVAAATVMGLGLGAYVTRPQSSAPRTQKDVAYAEPSDSSLSDQVADPAGRGPAIIRCTGCGPTLAERRMASDMAGLDADGMIDGTSDPVVHDYLTQGEAAEAVYPVPPPSPIHQLPPPIARFAAGEAATPPPTLQPAQGKAPPAVMATAAGSSFP